MKIFFDTLNIYYLPQYLPVYEVLKMRGHECVFVVYRNKNNREQDEQAFVKAGLTFEWVENELTACEYYSQLKPDWILFGNRFSYVDTLPKQIQTAQLGHGIGPKTSYYHKSAVAMSVRFIEGDARLEKIQELYPDQNFEQVGFCKLDPLFRNQVQGIDLVEAGLDPSRPTLLYAPTYNPSSLERFPDDWPEDLSDCNILIKPHAFTFSRKQYKNQRRKLARWSRFENVLVASPNDLSLLPFMAVSDLLISEASSTLFEFAALDKPVVVANFYQMKWTYRGPLRYRFERRFGRDNVIYQSIGPHVEHYRDLVGVIRQELKNPMRLANERAEYTRNHVGPIDGKVSVRIVDYLEKYGSFKS
jgi:hypothetical protein